MKNKSGRNLRTMSLAIALALTLPCSGTASNSPNARATTPQAQRTNQVLVLDGESGSLQVSDFPALHTISNAITVEAWCLARSFYSKRGSVNSVLRKNVQAEEEDFFLRVRNTDGPRLVEFGLGTGLGVVQGPTELKTNQWYHLAGTYDGSSATIYVNGQRIKREPKAGHLSIDTSELVIGKGDPEFSSGEYFHGLVDEIRIWNVARSPAELRATLNTRLTGKEKGLVAYWSFDDGSVKEQSGNVSKALLQGGARLEMIPRQEISPAKVVSDDSQPEPAGLDPKTRIEVVEALWRNLSQIYPALEYKGIRDRTWIEPALHRARDAKTDEEFYGILLEQMASLKDTHTRILSYPGQPRTQSPSVMLNKVEGKVAVIRAEPTTTLNPGDIITAVEERPAEECLAQQMKRVCNSTELGRIREACGLLLGGPPGTPVKVTVQASGGTVRQVTLRREFNVSFWREPAVSTRKLTDSTGYVRISHWGDNNIPAEFDKALEEFRTMKGLIIDVRGNGGGNDQLGDVVNGRLITTAVVSSIDFWRKTGTDEYVRKVGWVEPRGPWTYDGRVAVLIDEACASACEHFVSGIEAMGHVLLVGQPTNGAGGGPTRATLPDGTQVAISRALGVRANGVVFEGHGIPPHIYASSGLKDLRDGRDVPLEVARDWLTSGQRLPPRAQPLAQPVSCRSL